MQVKKPVAHKDPNRRQQVETRSEQRPIGQALNKASYLSSLRLCSEPFKTAGRRGRQASAWNDSIKKKPSHKRRLHPANTHLIYTTTSSTLLGYLSLPTHPEGQPRDAPSDGRLAGAGGDQLNSCRSPDARRRVPGFRAPLRWEEYHARPQHRLQQRSILLL